MFNVYRDGVRSFSGPLERLREIRPIRASAPVAARRDEPEPEREAAVGASPAAVEAYRRAAKLSSREPIVHAHQIMSTPVQTVRPETDLRDAWRTLRDKRIRQLPVQAADQSLVGMLMERTLLEHLIVEDEHIRWDRVGRVSELMERELVTAVPLTDVRRIARVLAEEQLNAMPVMGDDDTLVGIVTRGDLLRAMMRDPPLRLWT